jgi:hypothetical protein
MIVFHIGALFLALVLTPWLLARRLAPTCNTVGILACWGAVMVGLNILIPVALHLLQVPITANTLSAAHLIAGLAAITVSRLGPAKTLEPLPPGVLPSALLFAVLVIPVTHIAGIDTYKWQDLAGNLAIEGRISWYIHPLSLLGFTPRSYSSAQPLVLATLEMMGHTGVDWGFYILSLAFGLTGLAGAWLLGRRLLGSERLAAWFAFFYVFAPVFMRYNYWATGRGLLLALLPLYLLILLRLASVSTLKSTLYNLPAFLFLSVLLALSHKAGLIGALLIPILFLASPILIVLRGRWGLLLGLAAVLAIGLSLTGGNAVTLGYRLLTRFGWLVPLAAIGLYSAPAQFTTRAARAMLAAGFATVVLSCTPDMYGALLALPFVAFLATTGLAALPPRPIPSLILILTILTALVIVANQAKDSPDESVYRAALFLEQHDPSGPYRIEAPGKTRSRMQAYVSGCPRFTVNPGSAPEPTLARPPQWTGNLALDARHGIDYLRTLFGLRGASTDWYGSGNKVYTVTVADEGSAPPDAPLLFTHGTVKVYGPRN